MELLKEDKIRNQRMAEFLKTESRLIQKKSDPEDAVNLDMDPLKFNVNDEYGFFTE